MSILLWITTEMEYKIKCYNRSVLLPRVVIKLTNKGLTALYHILIVMSTVQSLYTGIV